jgi:dTDP-4-amino-4,6-dideoxygalactose transaminase
MKVPFWQPAREYRKYQAELDAAIHKVLDTGALILKEDVSTFEERLAKYVGTNYAIGVNSGTDALFLSLKALGVGAGDEVITVGHTFHATTEVIHHAGATPVLVDVREDDSQMDVDKCLAAVTDKTKAIIPVHLMGDMVDMPDLLNRMPQDLIIIEDACQGMGSNIDGTKAGAWGETGAFSFYPAKILGCYGDGGAITTNDKELYEELKEMRQHYKTRPGKWGFNSRLDNLQAAILNVKLDHLETNIARRAEVAEKYDDAFWDLPFKRPNQRDGRTYQDYIIRTPELEKLRAYLTEKGIDTMRNEYHFPDDLPKPEATIQLEKETLRLPCNQDMTDEEVDYVTDTINDFYSR